MQIGPEWLRLQWARNRLGDFILALGLFESGAWEHDYFGDSLLRKHGWSTSPDAIPPFKY